MFNFKTALSAIIVTAGIASAASPTSITSAVTNVQLTSNYTGGSSPYTEGTSIYFVNLGGNLYASYYDNDKTKGFFQLALQAAASGKAVYIRYDSDNTLPATPCNDYSSSGCTSKASPSNYTVIQELAIVP